MGDKEMEKARKFAYQFCLSGEFEKRMKAVEYYLKALKSCVRLKIQSNDVFEIDGKRLLMSLTRVGNRSADTPIEHYLRKIGVTMSRFRN